MEFCRSVACAAAKASGFVLSLASPVLRKMICGSFDESVERKVKLQDVGQKVFFDVLDLWCGTSLVPNQHLDYALELAITADRFEMMEVASALEEHIVQQLKMDDCLEILSVSSGTGLINVQEAARKIVLNHFETLSDSTSFIRLDENILESVLNDDELVLRTESDALCALARWMERDGDALRGQSLLSTIRFGLIIQSGLGLPPALHGRVRELAEIYVAEAEAVLYALATETVPPPLRHLGPAAFARRSGRSVQWEQCSARHVACLNKDAYALAECMGRVYSGCRDGSIQEWDRDTKLPLRTVCRSGRNGVYSLAAWRGYLVSGHRDGRVRLWDVRSPLGPSTPIEPLQPDAGKVLSLAVCGERLASGSEDGSVRVWGMRSAGASACVERVLVGHAGAVLSLAAWCGRSVISGSDDGTARGWCAATGAPEATMGGAWGGVSALAVRRDRLYSASGDGLVREWAAGAWTLLRTVGAGLCGQRASCLVVCGSRLVTGSDLEEGGDGAAAGCEVRVWDPEALRCRQTLAAPGGGEVWALLPVGAALWGGVGRRVVVWE